MKKFLHEENFTCVGYIKKTYGYKGDVKLEIDEHFDDDVFKSKFLFIDIDGFKVPFRVLNFDKKSNILVQFYNTDDIDKANKLIGKDLYLLEKDIRYAKHYLKNQINQNKFKGYQVHDKNSDKTYAILDLREFPQQVMVTVMVHDKEILIPLNEQFIERINDHEKIIYMDLPEGLLDL